MCIFLSFRLRFLVSVGVVLKNDWGEKPLFALSYRVLSPCAHVGGLRFETAGHQVGHYKEN
jgi:hypothetical protein